MFRLLVGTLYANVCVIIGNYITIQIQIVRFLYGYYVEIIHRRWIMSCDVHRMATSVIAV